MNEAILKAVIVLWENENQVQSLHLFSPNSSWSKVTFELLAFHWWSWGDGGQNEGPPSLLLLLLVHTFIQVFHYILRAGPIPQECTRQGRRAAILTYWGKSSASAMSCKIPPRLILMLSMKKGILQLATTIRRTIDKRLLVVNWPYHPLLPNKGYCLGTTHPHALPSFDLAHREAVFEVTSEKWPQDCFLATA